MKAKLWGKDMHTFRGL